MPKKINPDWCQLTLSDRPIEDATQGDILVRSESDDLDVISNYSIHPYDETIKKIAIKKDILVKWYILSAFTASMHR